MVADKIVSDKKLTDDNSTVRLKKSSPNAKTFRKEISKGLWSTIEDPTVQDALKFLGFDSFYVQEQGNKNLAVFKAEQVKSITGNIGDFSRESKDMRFSLRTPTTPEFKRWFGDGKVVDADGKPLVVYHSTYSDFNKFKTNLTVIKSVIKSNENRSSLMLKRVFDILKNKVNNKNICFLGVTFKANTDDMRDSSSLTMIPALIKKGAKINYFDPTGEKSDFKKFNNVTFSNNIKDAIKKSDLIIIHTEWNDFKTINFKKDVKNKKFSIFDMRNIYSANKMKDQKIKYFSIGN